eukprot:1009376_1
MEQTRLDADPLITPELEDPIESDLVDWERRENEANISLDALNQKYGGFEPKSENSNSGSESEDSDIANEESSDNSNSMVVPPPVYDASQKESIENSRLCRPEIFGQDSKEEDPLLPPPPYESDFSTCIPPLEEYYQNWKDAEWREDHVETYITQYRVSWSQMKHAQKRDYTISGFFRGDDDNMYRFRFSPPNVDVFLEMRSTDLYVLLENCLQFLETFDDLRMIRSIRDEYYK